MSNEAITDRGPRPRLQRHVAAAADALLAKGTSVAPVDVLMGIGWLPASVVDARRRGRAECLDQLAPVSPDKLGAALQHLRRWAAGTGLVPSEVTTWRPRATGARCDLPPMATRQPSAPGAHTGRDPT